MQIRLTHLSDSNQYGCSVYSQVEPHKEASPESIWISNLAGLLDVTHFTIRAAYKKMVREREFEAENCKVELNILVNRCSDDNGPSRLDVGSADNFRPLRMTAAAWL